MRKRGGNRSERGRGGREHREGWRYITIHYFMGHRYHLFAKFIYFILFIFICFCVICVICRAQYINQVEEDITVFQSDLIATWGSQPQSRAC